MKFCLLGAAIYPLQVGHGTTFSSPSSQKWARLAHLVLSIGHVLRWPRSEQSGSCTERFKHYFLIQASLNDLAMVMSMAPLRNALSTRMWSKHDHRHT